MHKYQKKIEIVHSATNRRMIKGTIEWDILECVYKFDHLSILYTHKMEKNENGFENQRNSIEKA